MSGGIMKIQESPKTWKINFPRKNDQSADDEIRKQIKEWIANGHKQQNVMLVTGDQGFIDLVQELHDANHTTMVAYLPNEEYSGNDKKPPPKIPKVGKGVDFVWTWRSFLSLQENAPSKKHKRREEFNAKIAEKRRRKDKKGEKAKGEE
ncbi:unnamed protein product [Arabis nemorensis]|uniref:NYN domain-containing protein n=1 Tax=Arabis nemorensis TaxID=586526 RepID=A0A565CX07_9BRAS|nr:unnamed protein product [Arabis nemorensis]